MIPITRPTLPPKKGYVEVEIDGVRKYKNVDTGEIFGEETILPIPQRIDTAEEQIAFLEDAICEMDAANSEAMAAIEDALCELDI